MYIDEKAFSWGKTYSDERINSYFSGRLLGCNIQYIYVSLKTLSRKPSGTKHEEAKKSA